MSLESKMIRNKRPMQGSQKLFFCFPYAGGGASAYYAWDRRLGEDVLVCPVQLPGREERIMEETFCDIEEAIGAAFQEIWSYRMQPIYLYGHSMGTKLAYGVAREFERLGRPVDALFVSGCRIPEISEPNPIGGLPDPLFKKALSRFDGTPKEVLENEELMEFFLPLLRADFQMAENGMTNTERLSCPIIAAGGWEDLEATEIEIQQWKDQTTGPFVCEMFSGTHFFIKEQEEAFLAFLKENLCKVGQYEAHLLA